MRTSTRAEQPCGPHVLPSVPDRCRPYQYAGHLKLSHIRSRQPQAFCLCDAFPASQSQSRVQQRRPHAAAYAHPAGDKQVYRLQGECTTEPSLFFDAGQCPTPDLVAEVLPTLSPKQLADAIWGFAKQGIRPAEDVMDAIASEVLTKLQHFRSSDLSNTIWALAVLKYQPQEPWWDMFERKVYQHVTDFTDREVANLMWSLAFLEHKPAWVLEPLLSAALDQFPSYSPNALHLVGWSCGKLGYCPSPEWLNSYLKAAQSNFFQFSPAEMSNIIWALAQLGQKVPRKWMDNYLMVAQWRFPSFSAKTLSVVAWAVARLNHTPSQEWLVSYEQHVREKFWEFTGQELACIAWALRRFGAAPEDNAVFYMLERQNRFLEADFEILSNSRLLSTVRQWKMGTDAPLQHEGEREADDPGAAA